MKLKRKYKVIPFAEGFAAVPIESDGKNHIISLNRTSAVLFEKLSDECDEKELVSFLVKEYGIDEKEAERDVKEFIDNLKTANLI